MIKLMKNKNDLRILAIHHDTPDVKSYTTILFEKILPILKSKKNIQMTWIVHKNEKIEKRSDNVKILDIHDFDNAVEVIQKVKPNLVYVIPGLNAPDYALALAAKYFKIPTIGGELGITFFGKNMKIQFLKSLITQFFQSSTSFHDPERKQLMGKGKFFIYKHIFLLKTQKAIKQNQLKIIKESFSLLFMYLFRFNKINLRFDSRFSVDLHFLDGEIMIKQLLDAGFKKSSLVVTGNPIHDIIFQELQNSIDISKNSKKIRVLLITSNMSGFEHNWVKIKRDCMIKGIIKEVNKNKDNIELNVKIHPSAESLNEYQKLIHAIDPSIRIFQKESILQLIKESDVLISTNTSTAMVCGLLSKKPLIIYNCFQLDWDEFLTRKLAIECKKIEDIVSSINIAISSKPSMNKTDEFIKEVLFRTDGKSAKRISKAIINLVDSKIQK